MHNQKHLAATFQNIHNNRLSIYACDKKYPLPHTYTSSGWQTQDTELQTRLAGRSAYFDGRKWKKKVKKKKENSTDGISWTLLYLQRSFFRWGKFINCAVFSRTNYFHRSFVTTLSDVSWLILPHNNPCVWNQLLCINSMNKTTR